MRLSRLYDCWMDVEYAAGPSLSLSTLDSHKLTNHQEWFGGSSSILSIDWLNSTNELFK